MVIWLKRYWPALLASAFLIAILDSTLSSLMTCHPTMGNEANQSVDTQKLQECTALMGPILLSLEGIVNFLDKHGEAVVAAFTAVLAVFTARLWWSTDKLWIATSAAAKARSDDTRILQRAYIAVESSGVELRYVRDSVAHIVIKNVGNLPARNVRWFIDAKFSEEGRLDDFPIDESVIYGNNVVPPGTEMKRSQSFRSEMEEIFSLQNEGTHLYVWGKILYSDGFGESRSTKFCHRYSRGLITSGSSYVLRPDSMRYHQYGNDAD